MRVRATLVTVAILATTGGGLGLAGSASAAIGGGERDVYVPISPCRLLDTRPGDDNVGSRSGPLQAGETLQAQARGASGLCSIPTDATGVGMNVTIVGPSASSFLTVFPADVTRPLSSSLNWVSGQA